MSIISAVGSGLGGAGDSGGALGSFYSKEIDQSLRANGSGHLTRTPSSSGNRRTWTFSAWVKPSVDGVRFPLIEAYSNGTNFTMVTIHTDGRIQFYTITSGTDYGGLTTQELRDPSAWYHIVFRFDSTQSTAADRIRLYVNGTQQETNPWTSSGQMPEDYDSFINHTVANNILKNTNSSQYGQGYIAEVHHIDGTSYGPDTFGETKDGVWIPKAVSGVSYGTNGFHLPFGQDTSSGSSFFFNRSSPSQVTFTNSSHYDIGSSDDFTLEAFIRPTSTMMSNYCYLLGHYAGPSGPYMMLQFSPSGNEFNFYYGNGSAYQFSYTSGDIVAGQWHHIAVNRSSGNLRFFIDGTQKGSTRTSNTQAWGNNQFDINIAGSDSSYSGSTYSFDGYISNVRLVVGSAVYSDAASLTVPTATLTNVTNTKLLALTTSTFTQDASSNNVTGTVTGSGYFPGEVSPFASFNFFSDTSGNTNHFTENNLHASDVVLDSPTNNFATLNPLVSSGGTPTLSEGNLKLVGSGADYDTSYATIAVTSGKWYAEFLYVSGDDRGMFGVVREDRLYYVNGSAYIGSIDDTYGIDFRARSYTGTSATSSSGSELFDATNFDTGDIGLLCFDIDNGKLWFGRRDVSGSATIWYDSSGNNNGDPSAGSNPTYTFTATGSTWYIGCHDYNGTNIIANFGQDGSFAGSITSQGVSDAGGIGDFNYIESGFLALCTSNMPDITIGPGQNTLATDLFNTVLYTGDGNDPHAITGVGFAPDWVWIKGRNTAYQHSLYDSVRGTNPNGGRLASDGTYVENIAATNLKSFDSDGFTLSTKINSNQDTKTYVAWNWKAGGSADTFNINGTGYSSASDASLNGGDITPTGASINTAAGLSIIAYTGDGTSGARTIKHGLSSAPELIFIKDRDSNSNNNQWQASSSVVGDDYGYLSTTAAFTGAALMKPTSGDATTVSVGISLTATTNESGDDFIMYLFHSVEGYSKVGTYTGNQTNHPDGKFVYTGFRPALVVVKTAVTTTSNWIVTDNKRASAFNGDTARLYWNTTGSETAYNSSRNVELFSNGFMVHGNNASDNANRINQPTKYLFYAVAEAPFKFANAR